MDGYVGFNEENNGWITEGGFGDGDRDNKRACSTFNVLRFGLLLSVNNADNVFFCNGRVLRNLYE